MGGRGSGNRSHWWRAGKKTTVEDCLSIGVIRWIREGIRTPEVHCSGSWEWTYPSGKSFSVNYQVQTSAMGQPYVRLFYSWIWREDGQPQSADYRVDLAATRPRFGGQRWWFICPLIVDGRPCERRAAKLYLPTGARYFGCRRCHDLTYTSCQESHSSDGLYRLMAADWGYDFASFKREQKARFASLRKKRVRLGSD